MSAFHLQFIESVYDQDHLVTASPGRRLGGYLLEGLLFIITLVIGWFIWFCIVARNGQTPAKQLLRMYTMKSDGTRAGGGYTWLREWIVKGLVTGLLSAITAGFYGLIAALWCLWDRDRQCLWDKMAGTYIAYSPNGYKPMTANELRGAGLPLPARRQGGTSRDLTAELDELARLRDTGAISDDEYALRRQRLIERV